MLSVLPRVAFSVLASSDTLKRLADRYGLERTWRKVRRFVAGTTLEDAVDAAAAVERDGRRVIFDYLTPVVGCPASAAEATRRYVNIIHGAAAAGRDRHVSVKLSQVGLAVDRATALDNLRRLLDAAAANGMLVRLDLDGADTAAVMLDTAETVWHIGYRNLGVALHAGLRRALDDVERLNALGMPTKLVAGRYRESGELALPSAKAAAQAFATITERLLVAGQRPSFSSSDWPAIATVKRLAARYGIGRERFEFELPLGVRTDLQHDLAIDAYRVRTNVPFGQEWFPYFMRRLGDSPGSLFRTS